MTPTTRPHTRADLDEARRLGRESFGPPPGGHPLGADAWPFPGRHYLGTFEGSRLVAQVCSREYHSWWHGTEVSTNGIAAVAVQSEDRGQGLLRELFARTLADGLEQRGEIVSTLYPTAAGIYRSFGYEIVGSLDTVELPVSALAGVAPAPGVRLRRASVDDAPALRAAYDAWAVQHNGPLTRRGPSFPAGDADVVEGFTGVTIAEDDDGIAGYCSWQRSEGYDERAHVDVADLVARTGEASRALWRMLGSFASVVGTIRLRTSGDDVARLSLPGAAWPIASRLPYMLRVHDVAAALTGRRLLVPGSMTFSVAGDGLGVLDGSYQLEIADGTSACVRGGAGGPVFTPRGLALAYAGVQPCGAIRAAGLLTGPTTYDALLDAALGSRRVHVRDYF